MDQVVTLTPDVAAWLADLVARQTIEIGHPATPPLVRWCGLSASPPWQTPPSSHTRADCGAAR